MERKDVAAALERIRTGASDGVVIAWLNRFSRAPVADALRVYEQVQAAGGKVVAVDLAGIDPSDATGEMALTTMLAVNRMQWRQAAERWDMSRADAVKAGIPPSKAPFGYRKGEDRRLVVVPEEAEIVRELFERKAAGATWLELVRWLDQVAPKKTGAWNRNTAKSMLQSRTYLGEVYHGEASQSGCS